ncbi:MAG: sigma-70 family RNA polymerase sigma factor [Fimbriimonadaceae bacterium]|nr:sigma-70 family RNA polymerase sigma factor [Fimbriimonadaceae bacterium]
MKIPKMVSNLVRERTGNGALGREVYEAKVRESYKRAYAMAYRLTGSHHDADDLVQETFLRAYRFWHRYDPSLPFLSWIYRIMSNLSVDTARRKARLRTLSLDAADADGRSFEPADKSVGADEALENSQLDEAIVHGLRAMNAEFRTAVVLSDLEGMSYEEIAEVMQTSIGTVRSRIHRGRKQLREFLTAHRSEVAPL